jgi:hypothetical protein
MGEVKPTTPTATSQAPQSLGQAGAFKCLAREFSILPQVFNEPPSLAPTSTPTTVSAAGGAAPPLSPCDVPLGAKPVGKRTIPGNLELSVFDILNIFCCHWFLSVDTLGPMPSRPKKPRVENFFGSSSLLSSTPTWSSALLHLYLTLF